MEEGCQDSKPKEGVWDEHQQKTKIWSLESENFMLEQKLEEAVDFNQKHERELRNINLKLRLLAKEHSFHKLGPFNQQSEEDDSNEALLKVLLTNQRRLKQKSFYSMPKKIGTVPEEEEPISPEKKPELKFDKQRSQSQHSPKEEGDSGEPNSGLFHNNSTSFKDNHYDTLEEESFGARKSKFAYP